jgi:hypothetical protein
MRRRLQYNPQLAFELIQDYACWNMFIPINSFEDVGWSSTIIWEVRVTQGLGGNNEVIRWRSETPNDSPGRFARRWCLRDACRILLLSSMSSGEFLNLFLAGDRSSRFDNWPTKRQSDPVVPKPPVYAQFRLSANSRSSFCTCSPNDSLVIFPPHCLLTSLPDHLEPPLGRSLEKRYDSIAERAYFSCRISTDKRGYTYEWYVCISLV